MVSISTVKKGIPASPGIVIGKAYLYTKNYDNLKINYDNVDSNEVDNEIRKVENTIETYKNKLKKMSFADSAHKDIHSAHILMLDDPYLYDTIVDNIKKYNFNAEKAIYIGINQLIKKFEAIDDEYIKARGKDYQDIKEQLIFIIKGIRPKDLRQLPENSIVVSKDLTPSDTYTMDRDNIVAFATDSGGKTDHVSIIAQNLGIPAVVAMLDISTSVNDGDLLILDGEKGKVYINPSDDKLLKYEEKIKAEKERIAYLNKIKDKPAITLDEEKINLTCNISRMEDVELSLDNNAKGVGLFRTEFLYMNRPNFPSEEEQFVIYKNVAEKLNGLPLVIRTLDIGGDKELPYFDFPEEENPFLGWRALRISFDMPDIFKTQLRAIIRASHYGNIKIMLPFVISVEDILHTKEIINSINLELADQGLPFNDNIELGIMIETPASVILADELAKHVDFFSIGTNDLTQYTLCADRGNEKLSDIYTNYHPAVLKMIKRIIDAANNSDIWVGMCGGFASDIKATKLLLGLGLRDFSVNPNSLPSIKNIIRNTNLEEAKNYSNKILSMNKVSEIHEFLENN